MNDIFRLGASGDHLAAIAVTKLQGELAKDGREPSVESKGAREKSRSKKAAALKSSERTRGKKSTYSVTSNIFIDARTGWNAL